MGGVEGLVELWDTATGQKVQTFKGHFGPVNALAFSPDGTRLATGGADGTLRLWDTTARRDAVSIPQDGPSHSEFPELSPDGRTLLTDLARAMGRHSGCGTPPRASRAAARSSFHTAAAGSATPGPPMGNACTSRTPARPIRVVDVASGKVIRTFHDRRRDQSLP